MRDAQRTLECHAKLPFQFLSGHSIAAGGHQEDGKEPRNEAGRGFVEDRASGRVKLIGAPRAGIGAAFLNRVEATFLAALRTGAAVWPALVKQKIQASPFIRKVVLKLS